MRTRHLFIFLLLVSCILPVAAQSVTLQVAQQVAEGSKFQITLQMKDLQADPPQTISLQNCTLLYGPAISSGMSISSVNGHTTSASYYNASYTFKADKASTITIPAITVTDRNGKKYTTKATKLTIVPAGQRPSHSAPSPYDFDDRPDGTRIDNSGHFAADDMFVRISVDKNNVYEQEPVIATIKLYTHQSIKSFQMLTQPTFEGFLSEELETSNQIGTETLNGKEYRTAVLKRCILYPQKSGKLTLSSGTYEVVLVDRVRVNSGSFIPDFRLVEKTVRTPENVATIQVTPLPEPKPLGFDGAVGTFSAKAELSSLNLHTNEPVTYTYTVTGTGNIKYLKTPTLDMPPGMDVYTPKTNIDASYSNGDMTGTYSVTYTVVPQEVGTFEIPPLTFSYFDIKSRSYKSETLEGFTVKVAKGLNSGITEQQTISKGMTDILHIKTGNHNLKPEVNYTYHSFWYWMLYVICALTLITIIIVYRRQLKLNADVRGRQLARALRKAMKRFKNARQSMANHNSEAFYADINQALWGYLSDKLGIPASQLLRDNIASQLADYGLTEDSINNVITILDECEMARFTPMHSDSDMAEVYDKVVSAVKSIENVKNK